MSARPPAAFHAPSRSTYVKDRMTHFHATAKRPMPIARFVGVSYQTSTSNHNILKGKEQGNEVSLIKLLHQTTTVFGNFLSRNGCLLSNFYIKPQLSGGRSCSCAGVSYQTSTSNHNHASVVITGEEVSLIKLLHQTTTYSAYAFASQHVMRHGGYRKWRM